MKKQTLYKIGFLCAILILVFKCIYKNTKDSEEIYNSYGFYQDSVMIVKLTNELSKIAATKSMTECEDWLLEKITTEINSIYVYSALFSELIAANDDVFNHPFEKLAKEGYIQVAISDDNKIKTFVWKSDAGYNGYEYIMLLKNDDGIHNVDFLSIYLGEYGKGSYGEFHNFKIWTMNVNNKKYYLIEMYEMKTNAFYSAASIGIYSISGNTLKEEFIMRDSKDIFSGTGFEFVGCPSDPNDSEKYRSWLFDYNDDTKTIYVPLVDDTTVTDRFLIYQWNGKYFKYTGVGKYYTDIPYITIE